MGRTTIDFEYKNKKYSLGFTVDTLKRLEKNGFAINKMSDYVLTAPEELFNASFNAFHKDTPLRVRTEIYNSLCADSDDEDGNSASITEALIDMVTEVIEEMKPKGNTKWKVQKS